MSSTFAYTSSSLLLLPSAKKVNYDRRFSILRRQPVKNVGDDTAKFQGQSEKVIPRKEGTGGFGKSGSARSGRT